MDDALGTSTTSGAPGVEFRLPSDDFPGFPGLALVAPEGWAPDPRTGAAMLVYDTASPDHFRTNALLTIERVPADTTLPDLVRTSAQRLAESVRAYHVRFARTAVVAGQPASVRVHTWEVDELPVPVFQVEVLLLAPEADPQRPKNLVQLHVTCASDQAEQCSPAFEQIVQSLRLLDA
jgi:hypothetical protein